MSIEKLQQEGEKKTFFKWFRVFLIVSILVSVLFVIFCSVPIFKYGTYLYPVPEGLTVPPYIKGHTSILYATLKDYNPVVLITVILSMVQSALSFCLLVNKDEKMDIIKKITYVIFAVLVIMIIVSFGVGHTCINQNTKIY